MQPASVVIGTPQRGAYAALRAAQHRRLFAKDGCCRGQYDASGNVLQVGGMPRVFDYDGEGRQVRATINGVETTYVYDAEGRRVRKTAACGTGTCATVYVLDAAGQVAAEYAMDGGSGTGRRYMTGDHLGSVRAVTDAAGLVKQSYDYLPFGGDLSAGDGGRTAGMGFSDFVVGTVGVRQPLEFTGKERDSESGLDYFGARYFSGAQGRFTSADPISATPVHIIDPQRWNMYAYVRNNPLVYIDPDGRDAIAVGFKTLAVHAGHAALISVHRDGSATFGSYGPRGGGIPIWLGQYVVQPLKTVVKFGTDGTPLVSSLSVLAGEVAGIENVAPSTVDMAYFMTSDADTQILDQYLTDLSKRNGGLYVVGMHDCIEVCNVGMNKIGIGRGAEALDIPRFKIWYYSLFANVIYSGETGEVKKKKGSKPDVSSTFKPCMGGSSDNDCK